MDKEGKKVPWKDGRKDYHHKYTKKIQTLIYKWECNIYPICKLFTLLMVWSLLTIMTISIWH